MGVGIANMKCWTQAFRGYLVSNLYVIQEGLQPRGVAQDLTPKWPNLGLNPKLTKPWSFLFLRIDPSGILISTRTNLIMYYELVCDHPYAHQIKRYIYNITWDFSDIPR